MSGREWKAKQLAELRRSIAYHQDEHAKEIDRTNQRNKWIKNLKTSLEG
jgi:hypothetical protein